MIRLFTALEIPLDIKTYISATIKNQVKDYQKFRWEKPEKLHFTLKFIGSVEEKIVEDIKSSLNFICDYGRFNCRTGRCSFFYRNGKPDIFFISFQIDDRIRELAKQLNKTLAVHGVPEEQKNFKVHVTLARLKGKEDISPLQSVVIPEKDFTADEVVLYKSKLLPSGSVYTRIKTFNLKAE